MSKSRGRQQCSIKRYITYLGDDIERPWKAEIEGFGERRLVGFYRTKSSAGNSAGRAQKAMLRRQEQTEPKERDIWRGICMDALEEGDAVEHFRPRPELSSGQKLLVALLDRAVLDLNCPDTMIRRDAIRFFERSEAADVQFERDTGAITLTKAAACLGLDRVAICRAMLGRVEESKRYRAFGRYA
jgi:hypothetical protein